MQRDEQHIDQRPHAQPAEAEQLPDALLPVAEEEPVRPEPADRDAQDECGRPPVALRPVARDLLHEGAMAHAQQLRVHGAVGFVLRVDRVAATLLLAAVLPALRLVAVPAHHRAPDLVLGRRFQPVRVTQHVRFRHAGHVNLRPVHTLRVVRALQAGVGQIGAERIVRAVASVGG